MSGREALFFSGTCQYQDDRHACVLLRALSARAKKKKNYDLIVTYFFPGQNRQEHAPEELRLHVHPRQLPWGTQASPEDSA